MRHSLALVRAGDPLFFFSPPHGPSLHNDVGNSRSPSGVQLRSRGEAPPVYFLFFSLPSSVEETAVSTPQQVPSYPHPPTHPFAKRTIRDRRPAD